MTRHACACPKPSAPTDRDECGIPHMLSKPPKNAGAREWTVTGFKEYLELHRRNYELDNLWGPDEKKCSDDFARFVELEQFFMPIDNKRALIAAYEELEREQVQHIDLLAKQYEAELTQVRAELLTCKGDLACALTDLSEVRAELAEANNHITALEVKFIDSGLKSAALVEALELVEPWLTRLSGCIGMMSDANLREHVRLAIAKFKEGK